MYLTRKPWARRWRAIFELTSHGAHQIKITTCHFSIYLQFHSSHVFFESNASLIVATWQECMVKKMNTSIKKLGRWGKTAPRCYIKKKIRPKTDRENPPNPGSLLTLGLLTRYLGRDRNERTTVTPGRVAQPKPSGAQRGFFFRRQGNSPQWGFNIIRSVSQISIMKVTSYYVTLLSK